MKQIILILILNLTYVFSSLSQCENNVSTDYNSTPTNDALPSNTNSQNYLNSFDWVPRDPATGNLDMYPARARLPSGATSWCISFAGSKM